MRIGLNQVLFQFYIFPYIKITYSKFLNGNYEIILGWINYELTLEFPKKN